MLLFAPKVLLDYLQPMITDNQSHPSIPTFCYEDDLYIEDII